MNPHPLALVYVAISFLVNFLLETLVIWPFFKKSFNFSRIALFVLLINAFTWPLVHIFYNSVAIVLFLEIFAVIAESLLIMFLFEIRYVKSLLISLIANVASFTLGFVIVQVIITYFIY